MNGNLTLPRSSFVGRDLELEPLAQLLHEQRPLVTLIGPPGSGKTRMARHLAHREQQGGRHPGGVWFCELSHERLCPNARALRLGREFALALGPGPPAR